MVTKFLPSYHRKIFKEMGTSVNTLSNVNYNYVLIWSLGSCNFIFWNILISIATYPKKEEKERGKEARKVQKQNRIERIVYEMVSWEMPCRTFHSSVSEPFVKSNLLSCVFHCLRKHFTLWNPPTWGGTECIFSGWIKSDLGHCFPGSLVF